MAGRLSELDKRIATWMERVGHRLDRRLLGALFVWLGLLKVLGYKSATSIIASTIYFGDPAWTVPVLGGYEMAIGLCLMWRPLVRIALLLLIVRLPGTLLALVLRPDVCFVEVPFVPTIQGQYLIKDAMLLGATLVIGGTVRQE